MKVGAPFNPYRVFQGSFAPYWLLEHRGISAGAKLCYIRLLGFAGKDARCYPSLEKLGASLGVSERQARDYVKELERCGFIVVEQRGLRKTNSYLFVWTAELERLSNTVPESGDDPDEPGGGTPGGLSPDRNDCSGQDRKQGSAPDRNSSAGQGRNFASGPIGINSAGIGSLESSSSSPEQMANQLRKTTILGQCNNDSVADRPNETISHWARERGIQRLRMDRRIGAPDKQHLRQWSRILEQRAIAQPEIICALLDSARAAADRSGEWRNWSFLTLQIQLAVERWRPQTPPPETIGPERTLVKEDPASEWAIAKAKIRTQIGEIPFSNWFAQTRQIGRQGRQIIVTAPDDSSRFFVEAEYGNVTRTVLAELNIHEIHWTVRERGWADEGFVPQLLSKVPSDSNERGDR